MELRGQEARRVENLEDNKGSIPSLALVFGLPESCTSISLSEKSISEHGLESLLDESLDDSLDELHQLLDESLHLGVAWGLYLGVTWGLLFNTTAASG